MSRRICTALRTRGSSAGETAGIYSRARGVTPMVRSPDDERTGQYTRDKWSNPRSNTRTAGTTGGHEARHKRVCDRREGLEPELGDAVRGNARAAVLLRVHQGDGRLCD